MEGATDVTRRDIGHDHMYFNNVREGFQSGQSWKKSGAMRRAGGEDKCESRHTLRRGSEDGQEPRVTVDRAVIQLRKDHRDSDEGKWGCYCLG